MDNHSLSVNIIVKNAETTIEDCLKSVCHIAEEVIVVDTGSTDSTLEIIEKFPVCLLKMEWKDDFSLARNYALEHSGGEWILYLDADEVLNTDRGSLLKMMESDAVAFWVTVESFVTSDLAQSKIHRNLRMFRNRPEHRFEGRIHEQILRSITKKASMNDIKESDLKIAHFGYLPELVVKLNKVERNIYLLEKTLAEDPEQPFHLYNLGVEYSRKNDLSKSSLYLKKCLEIEHPGASYLPSVYYLLATNEMSTDQYLGAEKIILKAVAFYPDYTDLYFLLSQIYRKQGQNQKALEMLYKAVELGEAPEKYISTKGVGSYVAHYEIGQIYEALGLKKEAMQRFAHVIKNAPNFPQAYTAFVTLLFENESDRKSIRELLSNLIITGPKLTKFYIVNALSLVGEYELALHYIDADEDGSYMKLKNECLLHSGILNEAILLQKKILSDMPVGHQEEKEWLTTHLICFWLLKLPVPRIIRKRLKENSDLEWLEYLEVNREENRPLPEEWTEEFIWFLKKLLYFGVVNIAEEMYKDIVGLSNQAFAKILYEEGYVKKAAQYFLEIMKTEELDSESAFYLGEILFDKNQFERASQIFEEILSRDSTYTKARTAAAISYLAEGFNWVKESMEYYPNSELLPHQLEQIKESLAELQKIDWHSSWTPQQRRNKEK